MKMLSWLSATDIGREIDDILSNSYNKEGVDDSFKQVREAAAGISKSSIRLVITIAFAIVAMVLLFTALKIGSGNPAERSAAKTKLVYVLIAAGGLLLLSAIVLFIVHLADVVVAG